MDGILRKIIFLAASLLISSQIFADTCPDLSGYAVCHEGKWQFHLDFADGWQPTFSSSQNLNCSNEGEKIYRLSWIKASYDAPGFAYCDYRFLDRGALEVGVTLVTPNCRGVPLRDSAWHCSFNYGCTCTLSRIACPFIM